MGDSQSKQQPGRKSSPDTTAAKKKNVPARKKKTVRAQKDKNNSTPFDFEANNQYETQATASLVENGKGAVPFHGLLSGDSRPRLHFARETERNISGLSTPLTTNDDSSLSVNRPKLLTITGVIMTLRYTIILEEDESRREYVESLISNVFQVIDSTLNGWNEKSEVSLLNKLKPATWFEITPNLRKVFDVVDEVHEMTGGRYDPTSGVIKFAYIDTLDEAKRPPLPAELKRFKFAIGWRTRIERFKQSANQISKTNANTIIDFDGISKGYAVDHLVNILRTTGGYQNVYVDWGGEVRTAGINPERNAPWRTAIVNPPSLARVFQSWKDNSELNQLLNEDDVAFLIELPQDTALATSGDYFQIKKFGYHHIVNAKNIAAMRASKNSVASVSILAKSAAFADAIATASMTLESPQKAADFVRGIIRNHPDAVIGFCILGRNGAQDAHYTNHFVAQNILSKSKQEDTHPSSRTRAVASNPSATTSSASSGDIDRNNDDHLAATQVLLHSPGRISWEATESNKAGFIDIDSLVSVSMMPNPVVSFIVPQRKTFLTDDTQILQVQFHYASAQNVYDSIRFDLTIQDAYPLEDTKSELITATIEKILPGKRNKTSVAVKMADAYKQAVPMSFIPSIKSEIDDEAKVVFSQLPYTVCVVTAEGYDDKSYGLTGTSIAVSTAYAKNTLVFNVMHSSTFFAVLTGDDTKITCYCLINGAEKTAKSFLSNPIINENRLLALQKDSLASIQATVKDIHTVQDHAVVTAKITHSKLFHNNSNHLKPLVWYKRKYTHVT